MPPVMSVIGIERSHSTLRALVDKGPRRFAA
jgi:hypothetical protein